jgi:hypothetical protein
VWSRPRWPARCSRPASSGRRSPFCLSGCAEGNGRFPARARLRADRTDQTNRSEPALAHENCPFAPRGCLGASASTLRLLPARSRRRFKTWWGSACSRGWLRCCCGGCGSGAAWCKLLMRECCSSRRAGAESRAPDDSLGYTVDRKRSDAWSPHPTCLRPVSLSNCRIVPSE